MTTTKPRRTKRLKVSDCPLDLQQYAKKFLERLDSGRLDITAIDLSHLSDRNLEKLLGFVPENPKSVNLSEIINLAEVDRIVDKTTMVGSASESDRNDMLAADRFAIGNLANRGGAFDNSAGSLSSRDRAHTLRERRAKPSGHPKPVPGFKCTVSPAGTVRSTVSGRVLKQSINKGLAYVVVRTDEGIAVEARVARLVVLAAGFDCYCKTVVHIDNDFTNYDLDNLKIMSIHDASRERSSMFRAKFYKDDLTNDDTLCPVREAMGGYIN